MRHALLGSFGARGTSTVVGIVLACAGGLSLASAQVTGTPNAYGEGFEHIANDFSTLNVGSNGTTVIVQSVGANGGNGVEVRTPTGKGKGARLNFGPLLSTPGASAAVSFRDLSGHAQCVRTITSTGDGVDHSRFDFSGIGAVSVTIDEYGADGRLIWSKTFPGPIGEKSWTPVTACADGSSTLESVRWTKDCDTCTPVLEIERVCPSDGASWLSSNPRAKIVVRGDLPTQVQFGDVIDSLVVTSNGIPSFEVVERHIETFGAKVKGTGNVHLTEACPEGAVCADQSLAYVRMSNVGGSGGDGAVIEVPPSTALKLRKTDPEAYQPWDEELSIELSHPAWPEPKSIACMTSSGTDGRIVLTFDGHELETMGIELTTRLNGAITGVASGSSSSIRVSVMTADWIALDPIFSAQVGARLRSGVIAEVGAGRPATVGRRMTIHNGLQTTDVIANEITASIIGAGQVAGISGGAIAARVPGGGAMDLLDVNFERVCPGDLNGDRVVEDTDFVIFAGSYDVLLCDDPAMPSNCASDLNFDGWVDDQDFVLFASAYDELMCP